MKIAYICSPYTGEVKRNKEYARELTLQAVKDGYAPITPHLYITECLNDNEPTQRDLGLSIAVNLLKKCDAIYIGRKYGISMGMKTAYDSNAYEKAKKELKEILEVEEWIEKD